MKARKLYLLLFMQCCIGFCNVSAEECQLSGADAKSPASRALPTNVENLKVLLVGNSYSEDCAAYVDELMAQTGIEKADYCVYVAYRGQGSLKYWAERLSDDDSIIIHRRAGSIEMNAAGPFCSLLSQDWDVVSFQQYSGDCTDFSTYNPYLSLLTEAVMEYCTNSNVSIVWLMPWRYESTYPAEPQGAERYEAICNATKAMLSVNDIETVIPVGTAIENARHTSLQTVRDLTYDGTHLAYGRGKYIAACTLLQSLFKPAFGINVVGNNATHLLSASERAAMEKNDAGEADVTEENKELCQRCAAAAVDNWFEVTELEKEKPSFKPVPVVNIYTENGQLPTCTRVNPPAGCWGKGIADNEYVMGRMTINEGDSLIYESGNPVVDDSGKLSSGMRFRIRGNTSAYDSYPSYKIKLGQKENLMSIGNCVSKNWNLMRPWGIAWNTPSLFRNLIGQTVGELVGMDWQPQYSYCELYINDKYRGLYWMADAIERDDDRVDIKKTGFIAESDAYFWQADSSYWFRSNNQLPALGYTFKYPEKEDFDADDQLLPNIAAYFNEVENVLYSGGDIAEYLNLKKFAAWMLAQDLLGNSDVAGANMYFYKKKLQADDFKAGKLNLGPLWDFDWICDVDYDKWGPHHRVNYAYGKELFKYEAFVEEYITLCNQVLPVVETRMMEAMDSIRSTYGDNMEEVLERTHELRHSAKRTVEENIEYVNDWFSRRTKWMQENVHSLRDGIVYPIITTSVTSLSDNTPAGVYDLSGCKVLELGGADNGRLSRLPHGIYLIRHKDGRTTKTANY